MTRYEFEIDVSYSQIGICSAGHKNPFSEWEEINSQQGFVWRRDAISFGTPLEKRNHYVNLIIEEEIPALIDRCVRAVRVPFVNENDKAEVFTVTESRYFDLNKGEYSVQVEFVYLGDFEEEVEFLVVFRLNKGGCQAAILQADEEMVEGIDIDMNRKPISD